MKILIKSNYELNLSFPTRVKCYELYQLSREGSHVDQVTIEVAIKMLNS